MNITISANAQELGCKAAAYAAQIINESIGAKGYARIVLSTGASQFETLQALVSHDIDWGKVEMFHLDEYIGLPVSHPASFRKYLKERFLAGVQLRQAHLVDGEGDVQETIRVLTEELRKDEIDLALIGIGENAHIAFNDPPADFATKEAYIVVDLDEACKRQQVGEGWFATPADVPKQAISMTVHQILQSKAIISCVPHKVKAKAIRDTLKEDVTNRIPATILKTHPNWSLFLDEASSSELRPELIAKWSDQ
ncbi:MAG: Glucosamine-6-phosphate deaminase [Paenibacillaceae bacterium]|jgi:glucosamine-6-phosphate deaminase|nr:Glucosamine-6-phosphate deaminase [Paenibacillaceae bacterium]